MNRLNNSGVPRGSDSSGFHFKAFVTQSRTDNRQVLKLGEYILHEVLQKNFNTFLESSSETLKLRKEIERYIEDFNLRSATVEEYKSWTSQLNAISISYCTTLDLLPSIIKKLFQQLRFYHDPVDYPVYRQQDCHKIHLGDLTFASKEAVRCKALEILRNPQMDFTTDHESAKFMESLVRRHPNADTKLANMKSLKIGYHPEDNIRVLSVIYQDDSSDHISIRKCLDTIEDLSLKTARQAICTAIFHFVRYYKSTDGALILDYARKCRPPPEYQHVNGRIVNWRLANAAVQNYVRALIDLIGMCSIQPFQPHMYPENKSISIDSLDNFSMYKGFVDILFSYLHALESEKTELIQEQIDEDAFAIWRQKEFEKIAKNLSNPNCSESDKEYYKTLLAYPERLTEAFLQLQTEEDLNPINQKLEEAMTSAIGIIRTEFENKKELVMKKSTYIYRFYHDEETSINSGRVQQTSVLNGQTDERRLSSASSSASGSVAESYEDHRRDDNDDDEYNNSEDGSDHAESSAGSASRLSGGQRDPAALLVNRPRLGLMSSCASSSEKSRSLLSSRNGVHRNGLSAFKSAGRGHISSSGEVRVVDVMVKPYFDSFVSYCLLASESLVLPHFFFALTSWSFSLFHERFTSEMIHIMESDSFDFGLRIRAVSFLTSFCLRAAKLDSFELEKNLLAIAQQLLDVHNCDIKSFTDASLPSRLRWSDKLKFYSTLYSGIISILTSRWSQLTDVSRIDVEVILRIFLILVRANDMTNGVLLSRTEPSLIYALKSRLANITLDGFVPFVKFKAELEQIMVPPTPSSARIIGPFDQTDLKSLQTLVQKPSDWLETTVGQTELTESSNLDPLSATRICLEAIWEIIVENCSQKVSNAAGAYSPLARQEEAIDIELPSGDNPQLTGCDRSDSFQRSTRECTAASILSTKSGTSTSGLSGTSSHHNIMTDCEKESRCFESDTARPTLRSQMASVEGEEDDLFFAASENVVEEPSPLTRTYLSNVRKRQRTSGNDVDDNSVESSLSPTLRLTQDMPESDKPDSASLSSASDSMTPMKLMKKLLDSQREMISTLNSIWSAIRSAPVKLSGSPLRDSTQSSRSCLRNSVTRISEINLGIVESLNIPTSDVKRNVTDSVANHHRRLSRQQELFIKTDSTKDKNNCSVQKYDSLGADTSPQTYDLIRKELPITTFVVDGSSTSSEYKRKTKRNKIKKECDRKSTNDTDVTSSHSRRKIKQKSKKKKHKSGSPEPTTVVSRVNDSLVIPKVKEGSDPNNESVPTSEPSETTRDWSQNDIVDLLFEERMKNGNAESPCRNSKSPRSFGDRLLEKDIRGIFLQDKIY